ncbi:glycoside hydrolase family 16 protein [Nocardioides sp. TF02-7]|uniref:glycoside hydrolase family 16 protein n=1 Tax=Nocardioides sp. TF02-7 TaxID=2917724 RepID=UPI001F070CBB|nr:glycoside hydrolase family 16 protein [Nocardioides sp. TF02-7]UMG91452.1 glycoside hydrolase family 16 protein [Nocardioides sp. TF02-7]
MRSRALLVMLACLATAIAGLAAVVDAPSSEAAQRTTLDRPRTVGGKVVFKGRAQPRARVVIKRRANDRWVRVAVDRADRKGRYQARTQRPLRQRWVVRAVAKGKPSGRRTVPPAIPVAPPAEDSRTEQLPPTTEPLPPVDLPAEEPPLEEPPVEEPPVEEPPVEEPAPVDECGEQPLKADGTRWQCSFVDDFDGTELDTDKWLVQETWFSGMTTANRDCYVNDPSTVQVADGTLRLSIRRGLEEFECRSPYGNFRTTSTAATVATYQRYSQTYGRFEFRAKFPQHEGIPGTGSGLWLYPQRHTYGAWPQSGEIDVAEWFSGAPERAYPSVHYAGEDRSLSSGYQCLVSDAGTQFHTYAVEWTPTVIEFFYDGQKCFEHEWNATDLPAPAPFDHPFYLVLTQAWGAGTNAPNAETPMSATLTVDWVRAWE